jgi:carboxyl-terminal processing protease
MKSNKSLIAIIVVLLLVAVCACTATAAAFAWKYGDRIVQVFRNQVQQVGPSTVEQTPIETPIPVGQDVDLATLFAPVWESRLDLQDQFFDQPVKDSVLAQGALDGLTQFLQDKGVELGSLQAPSDAASAQSLSDQAATPGEAATDFAPFWEAWRNVQYGAVNADLSYQDLMRASLRSMVAALGDSHTIYEDPFELRQSDLSLEGQYEGIGAWVDTSTDSGYVTIIAPMEGSPAEKAGILAGDEVIAVDGQDMTGVDGNVVISHILGPDGSTVVLTIQREGTTDPFDVSIVRSHIVVPSVESKMLDNNIAYIHLFQFGSSSADEMHQALQTLLAQNPSGLILDLRNDGGGYLDAAVSITSEFLNDGVVLYEEYNDGSRHTYNVNSGGLATDIPLVVLVNEGTASASEILSGAIQDYGRGQLVGVTTYGKGSVQISRMLANDQGALRITIAHWLTPHERQINGVGLEPDVVVELSAEDAQAGRDPQLDRAIEILTAQIN